MPIRDRKMQDKIELLIYKNQKINEKATVNFNKLNRKRNQYSFKRIQDNCKNEYQPIISLNSYLEKSDNIEYINRIYYQVSVPKFLFGSNYFLTKKSDLAKFVEKSIKLFAELGIELTKQEFLSAKIIVADICWNTYLPKEFGQVNDWIYKLSQLKMNPLYVRENNVKYEEDTIGSRICEYSRNMSSKFYDKCAEITNVANTDVEFDLKARFKNGEINNRIFRQEVCIQNKNEFEKQRNSYLKKAGFDSLEKRKAIPDLRLVFDEGFCKSILRSKLEFITNDVNNLLIDIKLQNENIFPFSNYIDKLNEYKLSEKEKTMFTLFIGFFKQTSMKTAIAMLGKLYGKNINKEWSNVKNKINCKLKKSDYKSFTFSSLYDVIEKQLDGYKSVQSLDDLEKLGY